MRITVHIEGKRYDIDIEQLPFNDTIDRLVVNGKPVEISVSPDWPKQFSKNLIIGNHSFQVEFELDGRELPRRVWAVGQAVDVTVDFPGKGKLKRSESTGIWGDDDLIRAPLPGKVIGVPVVPGQVVKAGDVLCKLEAMKMENELTCPRDGVIKEVRVKEGESVKLDEVLITLE